MRIHSLESFGTVDGPGLRFVVFLQGCPLRCLFCHNPDTWALRPEPDQRSSQGRVGESATSGEWTAQQLLDEVLRYKSFIKNGGVTCTGGEPLLQARELTTFFRLCHDKGIHTCLDTSGAVWGADVRALLEETDLVMLDIKTLDDDLHPRLTGQSRTNNQLLLDHLEAQAIPTWIRHVVVPGLTDDDARLQALAVHVARYRCVEKVEILPYHIMGTPKYAALGIPYPLEGVEPLRQERAEAVRAMFRQYVHCPVE